MLMDLEVLGNDRDRTVCRLAGLDAHGAIELDQHRLLSVLGGYRYALRASSALQHHCSGQHNAMVLHGPLELQQRSYQL